VPNGAGEEPAQLPPLLVQSPQRDVVDFADADVDAAAEAARGVAPERVRLGIAEAEQLRGSNARLLGWHLHFVRDRRSGMASPRTPIVEALRI